MQSTLNFKTKRANTNETEDLTGPQADEKQRRRRRRNFFSCEQCRSHKVKCDRGHPCSRCRNAKRAAACTYKENPARKRRSHHIVESGNDDASVEDKVPSALPGASDGIKSAAHRKEPARSNRRSAVMHYKKKTGKTIFKGQTHWSLLLFEFEEVCDYMKGGPPEFTDVAARLKGFKRLYTLRRTRNYPFGDKRTDVSCSKASMLSHLPEKHLIELYTDSYLTSFERTHRLLHAPTFRKELAEFFRNPDDVDIAWLSQLFMMLALGYQGTRGVESVGREDLTTVDIYLDGAEACLLSSPFMWRPTITVLRTLCMMAIAKQIDIVSLDSPDAVWTLIGVVVRLAISIGIHKDPSYFPKMPLFEGEMRKIVWTTIVFMNLQASIESGMPLLLNALDFDSSEPANINEEELFEGVKEFPSRNESEYTDSTFQIILARSFTITSDIISHANSPSSNLSYSQTMEYDSKVRAFLQQASALHSIHPSNGSTTDDAVWSELQKTTIEIFFRRVLLVLHRPYSHDTNCRVDYPDSYWSTLECSLALLVHQRTLYEHTSNPVSIEWFAELFKGDFFTAATSVCLRLRRDDIIWDEQGASYSIPAKQIISETLAACYDIWERKIGLSGNHLKGHFVMGMMLAALDVRASGKPLLPAMRDAAERSIAAVLKAKAGSGKGTPGGVEGGGNALGRGVVRGELGDAHRSALQTPPMPEEWAVSSEELSPSMMLEGGLFSFLDEMEFSGLLFG